MKKPFLSLKTKKDKLKILAGLLLCVCALTLFFLTEESIPVFANGNHVNRESFYGLVESFL